MKYLTVMLFPFFLSAARAQDSLLITRSHVPGLNIAITHQSPAVHSNDYPVLFLHGASFPTALAFGFKMSGVSWMDNLADNGYDVYGLDFLGYGHSDRYPEMKATAAAGGPPGRAADVYKDVDSAVNLVLQKTGQSRVYLIAHSWGGSVAALYAEMHPEKVAKLVLFAAITARQDTSARESVPGSYLTLTPDERIAQLKGLTPEGKTCRLEPEMSSLWGNCWLGSDNLAVKNHLTGVRFPSGPSEDVEDMLHGKPYYDPAGIRVPVLLVRGEWDQYPDGRDFDALFGALENAPYKKYVVIEKGTHVVHLEQGRHQLYEETLNFLRMGADRRPANKHAIAVIFEVIPAEGKKEEYLDIALQLKPQLEKIKGFTSIERFQSIYHPEKILSLSFWESEEAIKEWRNLEAHRAAQAKGRSEVFKDYHLRIAQVVRDYGMFDRAEAPLDSRKYHY
jgi:pimeloyl-ACP methyl ester carboxylesterase/heme-degrading monooxygenase HmoA